MKYLVLIILFAFTVSICNAQTAVGPGRQRHNKTNNKKALRYLFFSNGGIIGYFDDGTIAGCPRCDFCKSNILAMFSQKTYATYVVENDGSLLVNRKEHLVPAFDSSDADGWALINYKWNIRPPR